MRGLGYEKAKSRRGEWVFVMYACNEWFEGGIRVDYTSTVL